MFISKPPFDCFRYSTKSCVESESMYHDDKYEHFIGVGNEKAKV